MLRFAGDRDQGRSCRLGQSGKHVLHEQQRAMPGAHNSPDEGLPQRRFQGRHQYRQPLGKQGRAGRGFWQLDGEALCGESCLLLRQRCALDHSKMDKSSGMGVDGCAEDHDCSQLNSCMPAYSSVRLPLKRLEIEINAVLCSKMPRALCQRSSSSRSLNCTPTLLDTTSTTARSHPSQGLEKPFASSCCSHHSVSRMSLFRGIPFTCKESRDSLRLGWGRLLLVQALLGCNT